ncbi:MAG: hypothetical protein CME06_10230 [Gemmatimonadetes bacterium]|nr:hypothetical protein [Gemmatimonadota bacterium]
MSATPHGTPSRITVCVMTKSPLPGAAKSRLARGIGEERASRIARAMIADTWAWIGAVAAIVEPVLVLQGPKRALPPLDPPPRIWRQRAGDLGSRLESALRRAARESGGGAIAVGTDAVGLPPERLICAAEALGRGRTVLGPTNDGGYYLMGIPARPPLPATRPFSRR